ncbi:helix-turn-helix domain-containing protein [Paenibacillus sp. 481]|uniref:helix-turn-helix domain-containing protein n=1 Tax=Paenibacillus sp. 481 TaxID=2835869 RepID=UPI001E3390AA|nr:helix-turn-helix domain-containing protein [Paenibacillus sp. 481]UHA71803.1 helix-turn-helix domain-containing protein [Paenibacillus sp. 481]
MSTDSLFYSTLSDLLRHRRKEAGLSLLQVQAISNIHRTSISRIENGVIKRPEFDTACAVAHALQLSFEETVEHYIQIDLRADVLFNILLETIKQSNTPLITKVATKYLEAPNLDSFDTIENLYLTTASLNTTDHASSIPLALYNIIVNYSRDHGVMIYLAKGQLQSYLIERNDCTKLEQTYRYGKYILNYANFLSPDEQTLLYYQLSEHAYCLMYYQESIELSTFLIENAQAMTKMKAEAYYMLGSAHYNLGNYAECEHFFRKYQAFKLPSTAEKSRVAIALTTSKLGDIESALSELISCLEEATDNHLMPIITGLIEIYLLQNDIPAATELLLHDSKIEHTPVNTPINGAEIAYYYRLKGHLFYNIQSFDLAVDCYLISMEKYTNISRHNEAFESFNHVIKMILNHNQLISVEMMRKIDSTCAALQHKQEK